VIVLWLLACGGVQPTPPSDQVADPPPDPVVTETDTIPEPTDSSPPEEPEESAEPEPEPDPCAPAIVLRSGADLVVPGATLPIWAGPQGGWHLLISTTALGLTPGPTTMELSLSLGDGRRAAWGRWTRLLPVEPPCMTNIPESLLILDTGGLGLSVDALVGVEATLNASVTAGDVMVEVAVPMVLGAVR
jgi:hypothetical protein